MTLVGGLGHPVAASNGRRNLSCASHDPLETGGSNTSLPNLVAYQTGPAMPMLESGCGAAHDQQLVGNEL
jgi:hypothetical protein